ncbi:hypothetical protein EUGRSUZ_H01217 [Eucalyptus grandis]|uniref:Uncharacterized protein n=2 Tax=Eucalyptus grandis TaxID=71139 RepID=A0ACC3JNV3_EUCGR|nr:hypothetical protein EUGRSUZ_H01217 [Eucalyptus grandis]
MLRRRRRLNLEHLGHYTTCKKTTRCSKIPRPRPRRRRHRHRHHLRRTPCYQRGWDLALWRDRRRPPPNRRWLP